MFVTYDLTNLAADTVPRHVTISPDILCYDPRCRRLPALQSIALLIDWKMELKIERKVIHVFVA